MYNPYKSNFLDQTIFFTHQIELKLDFSPLCAITFDLFNDLDL